MGNGAERRKWCPGRSHPAIGACHLPTAACCRQVRSRTPGTHPRSQTEETGGRHGMWRDQNRWRPSSTYFRIAAITASVSKKTCCQSNLNTMNPRRARRASLRRSRIRCSRPPWCCSLSHSMTNRSPTSRSIRSRSVNGMRTWGTAVHPARARRTLTTLSDPESARRSTSGMTARPAADSAAEASSRSNWDVSERRRRESRTATTYSSGSDTTSWLIMSVIGAMPKAWRSDRVPPDQRIRTSPRAVSSQRPGSSGSRRWVAPALTSTVSTRPGGTHSPRARAADAPANRPPTRAARTNCASASRAA